MLMDANEEKGCRFRLYDTNVNANEGRRNNNETRCKCKCVRVSAYDEETR